MKLIMGNGVLGSEIKKQTNWDCVSREVNGIEFRHTDSYESYISDDKYTEIINCIAYTNTYNYAQHNHMNMNYYSVMNLVDLCNKYNKKLIHISTDYIYANTKSNASESDIPIHYNNPYIYSKILADEYIQARSINYLILRSSFKKRPFMYSHGWIDLIGNFDYVDVIASLMIELMELNSRGVYNVGTELKSVYNLALRTNKNVIPILKPNNVINSNDISMDLTKMHTKICRI